MKLLVSVCFLCSIAFLSCNNEQRKDSLKHELIHIPEMNELGRRIENMTVRTNADTAAINKSFILADSLAKNNIDSAKGILTYALYDSYNLDYEPGMVKAYGRYGKIYFDADKPDTALIFFYKALQHANKVPNDLNLAALTNNAIAATFDNIERADSAAHYLYQAARLLEQKNPSAQIADKDDKIYLNMARFWLKDGQADKGKLYLNKAEKIALLRKDSLQLLYILNHKADISFLNKKYDTAISIYKSVLQNPMCDTGMLILAYSNLGNCYLWTARPKEAIPYYTQAYELSLASNNERRIIESAHKLAQAYFLMNDYKAATPIFLETVTQAKKLKLQDELEVAYQYLAAINDQRNQYKEANKYRALLIDLWRVRYPKEKAEAINKLDAQFSVAEKKKELLQNQLALTQLQNQLKEKNLWIGIVAVGSLFILVLAGNMYGSNRRKRRLHEKQLQLLQQEQQIKQLQAVMQGEEQERTRLARELHDGVGGMLAAIKMNISSHDKEERTTGWQKIMNMVEATAQEVRKTAHNLMPDTLQRHHLQEAIRIYCDGINSAQNLQIDIQFHSEWIQQSASFELSVYRVLQELIQNIIKHAEANHVLLQFRSDNALHIIVEDDGKGFDMNAVKEGLGLNNIRSRLAALGGELSLESFPGRGTTCYIELPLKQTKNDKANKNQHSG